MQSIKRYLKVILVLLILIMIGWVMTTYYSFIFSRRVEGVIEKVERVELNVALMQTGGSTDRLSPELYSFAVAIREKGGEIVTSSAEDRQWAVAQPGQCADARYYPYPPWRVDKWGTYFGARLLKLTDCTPAP